MELAPLLTRARKRPPSADLEAGRHGEVQEIGREPVELRDVEFEPAQTIVVREHGRDG
jgi:hypothetical protein